MGVTVPTCERCGKMFVRVSGKQTLCPECRRKV
jgi:hypothetical protein